MRVALLSCNARQGDAIGNHVVEKLRFFQEHGAEVRLFVESDQCLQDETVSFTTVVDQPNQIGPHWDYLSTADLVIAEYGQYYSLLQWLPSLAGGKTKIVVDFHGVTPPQLWESSRREGLMQGVQQLGLLWCADMVLLHSRYAANELRMRCKLPKERIRQLGYVIEGASSGSRSFHRQTNQLRKSLGLQNSTVLLYVGRLAVNKRVPVLIEALAQLRDVSPPVHLLIVGDDRDVYQLEADRCRRKAAEFGLADRIHILGHRTGSALAEAYQSADVFVTASAWESFCIPLVEAMAWGVPVVAARNTAVPETLGDAGLTFETENASALAATVRRVVERRTCPEHVKSHIPAEHHGFELSSNKKKRIAIVAALCDPRPVNGAVRSLRTIGEALQRTAHTVEFLFAKADVFERGSAVLRGFGPTDSARDAVLASFSNSQRLQETLSDRQDDFDAIITGPYLSALTFWIAEHFPNKTLLLPCFHDEVESRLPLWHTGYQNVAGFLYHSDEEKQFAQVELGFNHPNSTVVGTLLPVADRMESPLPQPIESHRYLAYCGRYSAEKNLPLLLKFAERYRKRRPGRFRFVFMGCGSVSIPHAAWVKDLRVVPEVTKQQVLAGADALVNLSTNESLSLAALEAWQQGAPVIAHSDCGALAANVTKSSGGTTIGDYSSFEAALDDLWENPEAWKELGERGRRFVQARYQNGTEFVRRLNQALDKLQSPLGAQLRAKGIERARQFSRRRWRDEFAAAVEKALDSDPMQGPRLEVRRRVATRTVAAGCGRIMIPVQVHNWGDVPAVSEGPSRMVLCAQIFDESSNRLLSACQATALPRLLMPNHKIPAAMALTVPDRTGNFQVYFWAQAASDPLALPDFRGTEADRFISSLRLLVEDDIVDNKPCSLLLDSVQQELDEAGRLQRLPDDYLDVTQGALAALKRKIKHKLLHNFKAAYVDVLSRQQSAFNRQILSIVHELTECCALLDHAVQQMQRAERKLKRRKRRRSESESTKESVSVRSESHPD